MCVCVCVGRPTPITVSGAHRHEIASTLLAVVHTCHPASQLAWQLCADVSHTVMHDQAPSAALLNKYTSWHQQRILSWISAAHAALQATSVSYVRPHTLAQNEHEHS